MPGLKTRSAGQRLGHEPHEFADVVMADLAGGDRRPQRQQQRTVGAATKHALQRVEEAFAIAAGRPQGNCEEGIHCSQHAPRHEHRTGIEVATGQAGLAGGEAAGVSEIHFEDSAGCP